MKIRPATLDDATTIHRIFHDAFLATFRNPNNEGEIQLYLQSIDKAALQSQLTSADIHFLVAESSTGAIIGFCQIEEKRPFAHSQEDYVMLDRLYIDLRHQGTGVGRAIMLAAMDHSRALGMSTMWLMVLRTNTLAVDFYSALGFITFDTRPGKFIGDNELDLCMHKKLA